MNKLMVDFNASIKNLQALIALAPSKPTEIAIENGWPDEILAKEDSTIACRSLLSIAPFAATLVGF